MKKHLEINEKSLKDFTSYVIFAYIKGTFIIVWMVFTYHVEQCLGFFCFFLTRYIATDRIHCDSQRKDMMQGKTNDKNKSSLCTEDWSFKISSKIKKIYIYSLHRRSLTAIHIKALFFLMSLTSFNTFVLSLAC